MNRQVNVLGVGMTQFKTPKNAHPYTVMGHAAGQLALSDAGLSYADAEQACVGFVYGDSTAGQRVVYELGMSGIPVFNVNNLISTVGYDLSRAAALKVYEDAGIGPEDVKVVELHDCFTTNEVLSYEALGLTAPGTAERMIEDGDNTYGGKYVVNPSGGLISKGHPLGATGLAQCAELNWQLRDEAGERQVEGARSALQHNIGLGGCCVVTLDERTS